VLGIEEMMYHRGTSLGALVADDAAAAGVEESEKHEWLCWWHSYCQLIDVLTAHSESEDIYLRHAITAFAACTMRGKK